MQWKLSDTWKGTLSKYGGKLPFLTGNKARAWPILGHEAFQLSLLPGEHNVRVGLAGENHKMENSRTWSPPPPPKKRQTDIWTFLLEATVIQEKFRPLVACYHCHSTKNHLLIIPSHNPSCSLVPLPIHFTHLNNWINHPRTKPIRSALIETLYKVWIWPLWICNGDWNNGEQRKREKISENVYMSAEKQGYSEARLMGLTGKYNTA